MREKARIDEVIRDYVTLKSAGGGSLKGLCPFHDERSPSFNVSPSKGAWYCFGCGEKGNAKTFAKRLRLGDIATPPPTLGRLQSRLAALRRRSDYTPPPETSISTLYPGVEVWQNFRSIGAESVRRWELGYDPLADALLIPVRIGELSLRRHAHERQRLAESERARSGGGRHCRLHRIQHRRHLGIGVAGVLARTGPVRVGVEQRGLRTQIR